MKKNGKKKGFTLIELVVVIAILGILALIAVPRLAGFTDQGKRSAATAEAKTILTSLSSLVAEDNDLDISTYDQTTATLTALTGTLSGVLSGVTNTTGNIDFTYVLNGWSVTCDDGVLAAPTVVTP